MQNDEAKFKNLKATGYENQVRIIPEAIALHSQMTKPKWMPPRGNERNQKSCLAAICKRNYSLVNQKEK